MSGGTGSTQSSPVYVPVREETNEALTAINTARSEFAPSGLNSTELKEKLVAARSRRTWEGEGQGHGGA
jgi:hypothetical protein